MLKDIAMLWKDDSPMRKVVDILGEMVTAGEYVFNRAWEVCLGQAVVDATRGPLKGRDKEVNRMEREVRRRLLEHLSINPGEDASGCLALMIMAKDLERVGDHGRNLFELAARAEHGVAGMKLFERMKPISEKIIVYFPKLRRAILESSEEVAHEILADYQELKGPIKDLQAALFSTDMPSGEAVISTMLTRTLMRINAHIGNAASGVIFPLENIDFVSRGLRKEAEDGG